MDSVPSTLPSLYHPIVKTCAVTCVAEQPALALLARTRGAETIREFNSHIT